MRTEVYTGLCGDRDEERDDITCFTYYDRFTDPAMNARFYKCLPHLVLPGKVDWSIWVDANIFLKVSARDLVDMVGSADVGVFPHPWNTSVDQEESEVIEKCRDIESRVLGGRNRGGNTRHAMTGVVVRRHGCRAVEEANSTWWSRLCSFSKRDQLSFGLAFENTRVKIFPDVDLNENEYYGRASHLTGPNS